MHFFRLMLTANLVLLMAGVSPGVLAAEGNIKVTSIAEVAVEVVKNGKKEIVRTAPEKAVPGTVVIFTNRFENISKHSARDIVLSNPIPANTEYQADSAFGADCTITFSVDGGKIFDTAKNLKLKGADGREYTARPAQYTNIRWNYIGQLAAGKSGEAGFRAVIK